MKKKFLQVETLVYFVKLRVFSKKLFKHTLTLSIKRISLLFDSKYSSFKLILSKKDSPHFVKSSGFIEENELHD